MGPNSTEIMYYCFFLTWVQVEKNLKKRKSLFGGDSLSSPTFLVLHLRHREVPRLGVKLELQVPAYATTKQNQIWASSAAYTAACGNTEFLIYWARPGIKPAFSWTLVRFLTHWATDCCTGFTTDINSYIVFQALLFHL